MLVKWAHVSPETVMEENRSFSLKQGEKDEFTDVADSAGARRHKHNNNIMKKKVNK